MLCKPSAGIIKNAPLIFRHFSSREGSYTFLEAEIKTLLRWASVLQFNCKSRKLGNYEPIALRETHEFTWSFSFTSGAGITNLVGYVRIATNLHIRTSPRRWPKRSMQLLYASSEYLHWLVFAGLLVNFFGKSPRLSRYPKFITSRRMVSI